MRSTLTRYAGWLLIAGSACLFFFTVFAYHWQPDPLAAFTVLPPWIWGLVGITAAVVGFFLLRHLPTLLLIAIWSIVALISADETKIISNLSHPKPKPGQPASVDQHTPIRIITLNASLFRHDNPSADLARWKPDIILLQEVAPIHVKQITQSVFERDGHFRAYALNGIVSRWPIINEFRHDDPRFRPINYHVTIDHPDHGPIEIANLHYSSAATDLELWKRETWKTHRDHRRQRREEVAETLRILEKNTSFPENQPVILGGDFNTPPHDTSLEPFHAHFTDAYDAVGRGWGNTYHRRLPLFRIDQIYLSKHFAPARCRAVTTRHSDHRFVVADVLIK